jgi:hypothetical protein
MPKLTDQQLAEQLDQLENERSRVEHEPTPEDAAESAKATTEQTARIFSGRTPAFAAVTGPLLAEQMVDVICQYVLAQPGFADWLASQALTGELSRTQKAKQLDGLDAQIAELRAESNKRLIASAKAEAEARVKDEIAALAASLEPTNV